MFQELPHIYVEPDELKKAIQSTGMKNQKSMNKWNEQVEKLSAWKKKKKPSCPSSYSIKEVGRS